MCYLHRYITESNRRIRGKNGLLPLTDVCNLAFISCLLPKYAFTSSHLMISVGAMQIICLVDITSHLLRLTYK
jgi:hypothetical protein